MNCCDHDMSSVVTTVVMEIEIRTYYIDCYLHTDSDIPRINRGTGGLLQSMDRPGGRGW